MTIERRKIDRIAQNLKLTLTPQNSGKQGSATAETINISETGVCANVVTLPEGDLFSLSFCFDGGSTVEADCRIVWKKQDVSNKNKVGLEIVSISSRELEKLQKSLDDAYRTALKAANNEPNEIEQSIG